MNTTETRLAKISMVHYGMGGYQDAMFGASFIFESDSIGVTDFWGYWAQKPGNDANWTVEDQIKGHGKTVIRISAIMKDAKVTGFEELVDKPVELTLESGILKSWRILKEVL